MKVFKCMFVPGAVDCWSCAIIRFITWMLIFIFMYYMRELTDLFVYGEQVSFELKFKKVLFLIAFFAYGLLTSLHGEIKLFTKA